MLTIGQLAAHAGVTVRAIRHYHQRGLLPEPERDASGYRRYDAQAVVDLIRIKTLAEAGVPLARIEELLGAGPEDFAAAVARIDAALRGKIRQLTDHRRKIAELTGGERLFLPAEVVDILDRERALGIGERMIRMERDVWIMLVALASDELPQWIAEKHAALDDPDFVRIQRRLGDALDWRPGDPRLAALADEIIAWHSRTRPDAVERSPLGGLPTSYVGTTPAWQRLLELVGRRQRAKIG
ncbi:MULTISPECIES: MerR family transcriptional regulator [unclassified Nocardia]|uniref:MerR family transcriptional regulator n=1 Tax=unclassified Nocardia TaxID=2637762 RepID=UPI001CE4A9E7|nr:MULTISPECIES: MerR family transcriptional regulator [unclassified Nocardia]